MPKWLVSQRPEDVAACPDDVPVSVRAAASCDAIAIVDELSTAVRVDDSGNIIVPQWALFRIAARLEKIRDDDFASNKEL